MSFYPFFLRASVVLCAGIFFYMPFFVFGAGSGDVVIHEVMYDLSGADDTHEWVELYNASAQDIDVTGWKFNDGSNHLLNAPPKNGGQGAMIIPVGGYAVLADDAVVFLTDHPGFSGTVIDAVMSLGNTSATLTLLDASGAVIDTASYQKESGAAGNGMTLERSGIGSWKESAQEGGTPGAHNGTVLAPLNASNDTQSAPDSSDASPASSSQSTVIADAGKNIAALAGSEVVFDASRSQGNALTFTWNLGDGVVAGGERVAHSYPFAGTYIITLTATDGRAASSDQIEVRIYPTHIFISEFLSTPSAGKSGWVELYNSSEYVADLSGWGLSVSKNAAEFTLPENTFLAPHGFLTVPDDLLRFTLPASGELVLWYPHGQQARRIAYHAPAEGFSIARDGNGRFVATGAITPGARNVLTASAYAFVPAVALTASGANKEAPSLAIASQETEEASAEDIAPPAVILGSFDDQANNEGGKDMAKQPSLAARAFGHTIYILIAGACGLLAWLSFRRRPVLVAQESEGE